jgi:hypothetical protein
MSRDELGAAERIARRFLGEECRLRIRPLGAGLINQTFLVEREAAHGDAAEPGGRPRRAVLQRLNPAVFPNPAALDANLARLHAALAQRRPAPFRLPAPLGDGAGRTLIEEPASGAWRLLEYIEGSRTLGRLERPQQAREIGRVLGAFHAFAAELDPADFEIAASTTPAPATAGSRRPWFRRRASPIARYARPSRRSNSARHWSMSLPPRALPGSCRCA